ncbi:MAG TPA: hypothetical protein PLY70_11745 [Saprospiraceae bacterium]|nr:hypothetical protein [Saprospiraceae bacterium]HPI12262.1 hypothetical protein [Catalimonadaceae bacterium]
MRKAKPKLSKKKQPKSFEDLVKEIQSIKDCYKKSLDALETKDKADIKSIEGAFCGSVYLDGCQTGKRVIGEKRWDYIICHDSKLYFVEVHSAQTKNITELEGKAKMLKNFLDGEGSALKTMKDPGFSNIWLVSSGAKVDLRPKGIKLTGAPLNRYLASKGLMLYTKLEFPLKAKK